MHDPLHITDLIRLASDRTDQESSDLAASLFSRCWPGGGTDSTQAGAREWVRRWAPKRLTAEPALCSCAEGHCAWCN